MRQKTNGGFVAVRIGLTEARPSYWWAGHSQPPDGHYMHCYIQCMQRRASPSSPHIWASSWQLLTATPCSTAQQKTGCLKVATSKDFLKL